MLDLLMPGTGPRARVALLLALAALGIVLYAVMAIVERRVTTWAYR